MNLAGNFGQADGLTVSSITAADAHEQFMRIVHLADQIYKTTQDRDVSVAMLRRAYKLCPACPMTQLIKLGEP